MTPAQISDFVEQHYPQLERRQRKDGWAFWTMGMERRVLRAKAKGSGSNLVLSVSEKLGLPDAREVPFYGTEAELRALLDAELQRLEKQGNSEASLPRHVSATASGTSLSDVTDGDLERLARLITPVGQRLKWLRTGKQRLKDGAYIVDDASREKKWILSIYRNANNPANDVEIAIDLRAFIEVADGELTRLAAAERWMEWQRGQLRHTEHEPHGSTQGTFRIGLSLKDAEEFLRRLQRERTSSNRDDRWMPDTSVVGTKASEMRANVSTSQGESQQSVIDRMLNSARAACAQSGRVQTTISKEKRFHLDGEQGRLLLESLLAPGICAVTGLELDFSGRDPDLAPSLDRIDSDGDYEPGNVQVVAWFVNRWKSDDSQENFARLLQLVAAPARGQSRF